MLVTRIDIAYPLIPCVVHDASTMLFFKYVILKKPLAASNEIHLFFDMYLSCKVYDYACEKYTIHIMENILND